MTWCCSSEEETGKSSLETSVLAGDTKASLNDSGVFICKLTWCDDWSAETDNSKKGKKMSPKIGLWIQLFQRVGIIRVVCHQNFSCQLRNAFSLNKKLSDLLKAMSDMDFFPACTFSLEMPTSFRRQVVRCFTCVLVSCASVCFATK